MSNTERAEWLHIAYWYEWAQRAYSALPYTYFKNGYAFPCWHYFFEVTRRCNLRCKMCQYAGFLESQPVAKQREGELSTDEWHNVIDQVGRLSLITFTGGEPFIREDLPELLEHACRRSRVHLISNATLLTEERAEMLLRLAPKRLGGVGFNFLGTSIEAPGDRHDEIRQCAGAFERTLRGIRALRASRDALGRTVPMIHVTTVLQQDNVDVLDRLPRMLKDAGADVLNFVTETRMHDLPGLGEVDPASFRSNQIDWPKIDRRQLADALDRALAAAKEAGLELRMPRMPREALLDYYDGGLKLRDFECRNAWNTLNVGRKGDVYPCWIVRIGNVRENTLKELWNGPALRRFRQTCTSRLFAMCPGCCFLEHKSVRSGR